jgi:hypothetical protein
MTLVSAAPSEALQERIETADAGTTLQWSVRLLTARRPKQYRTTVGR